MFIFAELAKCPSYVFDDLHHGYLDVRMGVIMIRLVLTIITIFIRFLRREKFGRIHLQNRNFLPDIGYALIDDPDCFHVVAAVFDLDEHQVLEAVGFLRQQLCLIQCLFMLPALLYYCMDVKHWLASLAVDQVLYFVDFPKLDVAIDEQRRVVLVACDVCRCSPGFDELLQVFQQVWQVLQLHITEDHVAGIQEPDRIDVAVQRKVSSILIIV